MMNYDDKENTRYNNQNRMSGLEITEDEFNMEFTEIDLNDTEENQRETLKK